MFFQRKRRKTLKRRKPIKILNLLNPINEKKASVER
jgi:hypothetical protein